MEIVVDASDEIWIAAEVVFLAAMPGAGAPYRLADILSISSSSEFTLEAAYAHRLREEDKTLTCDIDAFGVNSFNKLRFNLKYNGVYANGSTSITFDLIVTDPKTDHTETINVTVNNTLSIDKLEKYDFSFGPNPTGDFINLSATESIGNVEIYNLLGQKSFSSDLRDTKGTLDISNLSKGVYIMNVAIDKNIGTYKLIKQ